MSTVYLYMKHDDRASIQMDDVESEGYFPFVNSVIGGEDTELNIDNDTGKIIGWKPIQIKDGSFVENR